MFTRLQRIEICAALYILAQRHMHDTGRPMDKATWDSLSTSVRETVRMLVECGIPVTINNIIDFVTIGG